MNGHADMDIYGIIATASNIRTGGNPTYTADGFLGQYPQFSVKQADGITPVVSTVVLQAYINLAQASIHYNRYHDLWNICMGLFIAHWLTLYLQTAASASDSLKKIINNGLAKGLQTSKSAGDLSVSYDFSIVAGDFDGWGTYKQTGFGQQFITLAKTVSMGGMVVW
ncbi:DUF4054 domain-containing protein [Pectinatus haikarae]|uniref:DUF4054 domain-containing protein n=1 Tax=Pectinatus haikarae TaxID=349096 RepID=A0ABT9Y4A8_9FIRM|nr:DUF4054 domain-containing protein [Pectinatus haikarae]MDQ0202483.1 hypothetical protein [Pectinatus haikarae]